MPSSAGPIEERFMRAAIAMAVENASAGRGGPFAALVVRDAQVIAAGTNGVTATNDPTAHAEMIALRDQRVGAGRTLLEAAGNRTILVVSHEPDIASWTDRVVALEAGRVVG